MIRSILGRSSDYEHQDDYEGAPGAEWVDATVLNSPYEEQYDTRSGDRRHRKISSGLYPWCKGRAPGDHDDA